MASDNKVLSFLLLIMIGISIYYLLDKDGFSSLNKLKERFMNNSSDEIIEEEVVEEEVVEEEEEPSSLMNNESQLYEPSYEPYVSQSVINDIAVGQQSLNQQNSQNNSQQQLLNQQNSQNNSQQQLLNQQNSPNNSQLMSSYKSQVQTLYDSPKQSLDNNQVQTLDNNNVQSLDNNPSRSLDKGQQSQMISGIYNFQANDESELGVFGSNLNDAFALPVPSGTQTDSIDFKKQNVDNYNARDFLPREVNDEWFETDFSLAKYQLNDDKLINTEKYIIGINTVGQSLKNASWDIRGTIPNPKLVVSPWNNSTYEPDFNLKPLC